MISESIGPILQWLNTHPQMAGLVIFLICVAESVAIIGTIIPGTLIMTAIGTLAGAGVISLIPTIAWAISGAVIGDNFSYFIGHHYKDHLRGVWPFWHFPRLLDSGEKFFRKHGNISVFIGRFIGPVRALVPLIAGMLGMKPARYITVSIIASILWAPSYLLPGIILGKASQEMSPDIAAHFLLMCLLATLFVIFCIWIAYQSFVLVRNQIDNFLTRIWNRLSYSRYFHVITTALKHHDLTKTYGQLTLAFYLIVLGTSFLYLTMYVSIHPPINITINHVFFYLFRSLRSPSIDNVMIGFTFLGEKHVLVPVMLALVIYLAWKKHWHTVWHACALLVMTSASIVLFKHLIAITRPWGIHGVETFSFPSGHTTISIVFYIGLGLLLTHVARLRHQWICYSVVVLIIGAVSLSRLYLGAHWVTDVVGAWLLGGTLLILMLLSYNRKAEMYINPKHIILITLITALIALSAQYYRNFDRLKQNYTELPWPTKVVTLHNWWQQTGDNLPFYRIGRVGTEAEVFNIQWLGELSDIQSLLMKQGWELPDQQNWITVLHRITDVSSAEHLPLVSPLYLDKQPVLVLIKHINGDKNLFVLRLWNSNTIIQGTQLPLWVGTAQAVQRTYSWLINYKHSNNLQITPEILLTTVPSQYDIKEKTVNIHVRRKHLWTPLQMIFIKPKYVS